MKENATGRRDQHDRVNAKFITYARVCGHEAQREPGSFLDPTTQKRPDGLLHVCNGDDIIYDVRGFDPLAPSYLNSNPSSLAKAASSIKMRKYEQHGKVSYPDIKMKPLIYSTLAGLTESSVSFLKTIAKTGDLSAERGWEKFAANAITAISIAIQSDNYAMVMKSFKDARP